MGALRSSDDHKVGILALQGAVGAHARAFARLGVEAVAISSPTALEGVDAIVIPGGESTAISRLLETSGLLEPLRQRISEQLPVFGTCAGMILLADTVLDGRPDQHQLGGIDIAVRRNAFGRQVDSFETDLAIKGLGDPFHAVFIRAPVVEHVGTGVCVLACIDNPGLDGAGLDGAGLDRAGLGRGRPVLCRQGRRLVSAFHPELSEDLRLHEMFLDIAFGQVAGSEPVLQSRTNS